jgi:hypothetical protein
MTHLLFCGARLFVRQFVQVVRHSRVITRFGICLALFWLAACAERTETVVPPFRGQVIDTSTSAPLAGVVMSDEAIPPHDLWRPVRRRSDARGRFSYPAVTLGEVTVFGAGVGYPISRRLTFTAEGYQARVCEKQTFSLFAADTEVRIGLQPGPQHALPAPDGVFLPAGDRVRCQAQVGDTVSDGRAQFRIDRVAQNANGRPVFSVVGSDGAPAEKLASQLALAFP